MESTKLLVPFHQPSLHEGNVLYDLHISAAEKCLEIKESMVLGMLDVVAGADPEGEIWGFIPPQFFGSENYLKCLS